MSRVTLQGVVKTFGAVQAVREVSFAIEDRSFVLVNAMSRNHGMRWDLSEAAELLGFLPEDDAFATAQPTVQREESW